jgi:hypothetical protein
VRLHRDGEAGLSALALGARAYSLGRNLVFAPGQYAPGTVAGRALLAHELCHVTQDGGRSPALAGPVRIDPTDSAGEREADQAARLVAAAPPGAAPLLPARQAARHGGSETVLHRSLFTSVLGGLAGGVAGAAGGALLGGLLGPVGAVVGGIVGGVAGLAAGALLGDSLSRRDRSLTSSEVTYLKEIYRDSVDYSQVTITRGSAFSVVSATTLGNTINLTAADFIGDTMNLSPSGTLTLAHEMGHIWQYQNGGLSYIPLSVIAQLRGTISGKSRNAAYDWEPKAQAKVDWADWNPEQQAECLSDYNESLRYIRANPGQPVTNSQMKRHMTRLALAQPYVDLVRQRIGAPGSSRKKK